MHKISYCLTVVLLLVSLSTYATADVSIGIGVPNVSIGINLPAFPVLTRVPGYPVYYAPRMDANYFFYDGMYWVYQGDNWYASSWYNGPWGFVDSNSVPLYILRIPVRYYRQPPVHFRGWQSNAPPRWGQHWGHDWEQRHNGWNRWKRSSAPAPAPLPAYQRKYSGDRYPRVDQQHALRDQNYRYQPRDRVVREHLKPQAEHKSPLSAPLQAPAVRNPINNQKQHDIPHATPPQQGAPAGPHTQPPQRGGEQVHKVPVQAPPQQRVPAAHEQKQPQPQPAMHEQKPQMNPNPALHQQRQQPGAAQHEQQAPNPQQGRGGAPQDAGRDHGQGQNRDEGRGR